jgi:hypothetical protein
MSIPAYVNATPTVPLSYYTTLRATLRVNKQTSLISCLCALFILYMPPFNSSPQHICDVKLTFRDEHETLFIKIKEIEKHAPNN